MHVKKTTTKINKVKTQTHKIKQILSIFKRSYWFIGFCTIEKKNVNYLVFRKFQFKGVFLFIIVQNIK